MTALSLNVNPMPGMKVHVLEWALWFPKCYLGSDGLKLRKLSNSQALLNYSEDKMHLVYKTLINQQHSGTRGARNSSQQLEWRDRVCYQGETNQHTRQRTHGTIKDVVTATKIRTCVHTEVQNWMPQNSFLDKSTLVWVMAWYREATSHYLSQYWPRSVSPYGVTWLQRVENPNLSGVDTETFLPSEIDQCKCCWCPGSLRGQVISSYGMDIM